MDFDLEATEKLCQENIDKVKKQIDKNLGVIGYYEIAKYCLDKLKNIAMPPSNFLCEPLEELKEDKHEIES